MLRHPRAVALAISNRRVIWLRLCGAMAIAGLIFASLLLPAEWERLRTGHYLMEHFLAYFVASLVICLGWPRPFVVAGALAVAAAILETLQGLTPNHSASVDLVIAGAAGALTAALIAKLTMVAWSRRARWRLAFRRRAEGVSDDVGKARTKHSERIAMASTPKESCWKPSPITAQFGFGFVASSPWLPSSLFRSCYPPRGSRCARGIGSSSIF